MLWDLQDKSVLVSVGAAVDYQRVAGAADPIPASRIGALGIRGDHVRQQPQLVRHLEAGAAQRQPAPHPYVRRPVLHGNTFQLLRAAAGFDKPLAEVRVGPGLDPDLCLPRFLLPGVPGGGKLAPRL